MKIRLRSLSRFGKKTRKKETNFTLLEPLVRCQSKPFQPLSPRKKITHIPEFVRQAINWLLFFHLLENFLFSLFCTWIVIDRLSTTPNGGTYRTLRPSGTFLSAYLCGKGDIREMAAEPKKIMLVVMNLNMLLECFHTFGSSFLHVLGSVVFYVVRSSLSPLCSLFWSGICPIIWTIGAN